MYLEAKTSNMYTNLVDEDRDYLLQKLKKLNSIIDMSEVSQLIDNFIYIIGL